MTDAQLTDLSNWDVSPYDASQPTLINETDGEFCYRCKCQRWDADKELPFRMIVVREQDMLPIYNVGRLCTACTNIIFLEANT